MLRTNLISSLVPIAIEQDSVAAFSKIIARKVDHMSLLQYRYQETVDSLLLALDEAHKYVDASDTELKEWGMTRDDVLYEARERRERARKALERLSEELAGRVKP